MKTIYLAGPILGDPKYKTRFDAAECYLSWKGWTVLNPACLPQGLAPEKYMPICLAMLEAADAICMLEGHKLSRGATLEGDYAAYQGKMICYGVEAVPMAPEEG